MAERLILEREPDRVSFAVIGMGNGGQAMAGYLALRGFSVSLWNRSRGKVDRLKELGGISLKGQVTGFSIPDIITEDLEEAVAGARVIMVTVPASGHRDIARLLSPFLEDGQIVVLNPGRTGGALEFRKVLSDEGCRSDVTVAEAGTFIYASRTVEPGTSHIYGIKHRVPVAALPSLRTMEVVRALRNAYPQFVPAENTLYTSFDNIGAIFHPLPTILNAGRVEGGAKYQHYKDGITPSVAKVLETLDLERLNIAGAYGIRARSVLEWMKDTYGVRSPNLYAAIQENGSYRGIYAPTTLNTRYLTEDIPFSLVPLVALAERAGVDAPLMRSTITIAGALSGVDYWEIGRKAEDMGISGMTPREILEYVKEGGTL